MRKVVLIVAPILLAYLLLTFFTGSFLGLTGTKLWILRGALWLIGVVAAAVVTWFFWDKQRKEEIAAAPSDEAPTGGEEIAVLMRDAERKLSAAQLAKGARIGNLPLILLVGEASSTKTSTMMHSGLEPELLAGHVYQDGNITSTRSANLWYSRQTIFVEASGKLLDDEHARTYLAKRLQPRQLGAVVGGGRQAPRAALVCVEIERITAGGQAMASTARNLRARLGEIAQSFGIQLPVYVLFTKTDRLSFFADFVRNLSNEEAAQPLGVTLPLQGPATGVWAEEETARLGRVFDQIFRVLCNARPELLARENEVDKLPGAYEFPREFKKLRGSLVQFLVDLCRPSQLTVGPFLRGFYFSGVRPVIVKEDAPAPQVRSPETQGKKDAREATAMFRAPVGGQAAAAAPQRIAVSRKVPQWLFLTQFFNRVLLADRAAMGTSGSSAKTDLLRRILLVAAAVLCLVFCIGFTVSFFLNRGLEGRVREELQGTIVPPSAANLASVDSLRSLEALRQSLKILTIYDREGAPLCYRWGLYVGNDLYSDVRRLYFTRFKALLFGQTQNSLAAFLSGLPAAPGPVTPAYDPTYDSLKAYLMTTSNHDKSTHDFLPPLLMKTWAGNATVDPERVQLAQKQFVFYSDELKLANPYGTENDPTAVLRARTYLKQFGDQERIYKAMKAGAPKSTINFNRQIGGSKDYVVDSYDVAGPFTGDGRKFMIDAIKNPSRYVHGEQWVLGDQGAINADPHELIKPLLDLYTNDYIKEWRNYLRSASVVKYKDLKDAADKLSQLSGGQSHLLALFALASQNIPWYDPDIAKALQPVQYIEPSGNDRYTNNQNNPYVAALIKLQASVEAVATSPASTDSPAANQAIADAKDAKTTTNQLATNFNRDPERLVQTLLLEPITNLEAKLRGVGADDLNTGGKGLCGQFRAVLSKYPFSPAAKQDATVAEVNSILKKPDGALWKFYEDSLKKFLTKEGSQYVPVPGGNVTLQPTFIDFFNRAATFSDFLYAGGADPHFTYTLKPVPTDGIGKIGLEIDGQTLDWSGGTPTTKPFTWQAGGTHGAKGTWGAESATFNEQQGIWAIFRLFGDADRSPASGGGFYDWIIRQGKAGTPSMVNGKPLTVRLELDMAGPALFQKGFFSRLACVAEVAKP